MERSREDWLNAGVVVGAEVNLSGIAADVVIHAGCRVRGAETSIGPGSVLGDEAPVVLENCQLGRDVRLKGGYFAGAVFFDGASMGSAAHVRAGTILEEEANGAHSVGLKQTILLPFVTTGSLINFCDALMAGGTSRSNHSEIGSSYIHFNFTPHQDKATASLLGDVPSGVFLREKPIFLGGQGELVGPSRIAYGSVVAAGGVCRQDILEEGQLLIPAMPAPGTRPYETSVYHRAERLVKNNLIYIGNLLALRAWYQNVRSIFIRDDFDRAVLDGGLRNLDLVLRERIKRLGAVAAKFARSIDGLEANGGSPAEIAIQKRFHAEWTAIEVKLAAMEVEPSAAFIAALNPAADYLEFIQTLDPTIRETGRAWLQSIVDETEKLWS